jgi:hypothetical protein
MYTEYAIPVFLCVAALILIADFWPVEVELTSEQNADHEEARATSDDSLKAIQTKSGAATTSTM